MAALELALIAPMLILVYLICADIFLLIRNKFRVDQAAVQGLQVATQFTSLYDDDFTTTFFPVIQAIAGNGSNSLITTPNQVACAATISGLDYPQTGVRAGLLSIVWQRSYSNGSCEANKVGKFDNTTQTPLAPALNGYTPPHGVPFFVVEVSSQYHLTGLSATTLGSPQLQYSSAMAIPRQRALPLITPGNRP